MSLLLEPANICKSGLRQATSLKDFKFATNIQEQCCINEHHLQVHEQQTLSCIIKQLFILELVGFGL